MELPEKYSRGILGFFFLANILGHVRKVSEGREGWDENLTCNESHFPKWGYVCIIEGVSC